MTSVTGVLARAVQDGSQVSCREIDTGMRYDAVIATDGTIYVGGAPAMSAFDATSGGVVWQSPPESFQDFVPATYSAPAVSDDYVAYASSSGLYVYDRLSGSQLWKVESTSAPNTSNYTHRSAAIIDTLLFTAGRVFDAQRGVVVAADALTMKVRPL